MTVLAYHAPAQRNMPAKSFVRLSPPLGTLPIHHSVRHEIGRVQGEIL